MRHRLLILLLLIWLIPEWALAATVYVRPSHDGNGNTLTYGTGSGVDAANAIAGFATIQSGAKVLAPGDVVCLPGSNEPFFEQFYYPTGRASGTAGNPITFRGCSAVVSGDGKTSTNKALFWSGFELTGNRSINASKVAVTGAAYVWDTVATNIYRKRVDYRPRALWEDDTWLLPLGECLGAKPPQPTACNLNVDYYNASEATILAALQPGQWVNKNNGDGTYRLYYRATDASHSPTLSIVRANAMPLDTTWLVGANPNYLTFEDIEMRGHMFASSYGGLLLVGNSHIVLNRLKIIHNWYGLNIKAGTGVTITDYELNNLEVVHNEGVGLLVFGGGATGGGVKAQTNDLRINGGQYSWTNGFYYTGSGWTGTDGDGIGIGFAGGDMNNFVFKDFRAEGNFNYGVFYGTDVYMKLTNLTVLSAYMSYNRRGCFAEGTGDLVQGTVLFSGMVCANSGVNKSTYFHGGADLYEPSGFANPQFGFNYQGTTVRNIYLENITLYGNANTEVFRLLDDNKNNYHLKNILVYNNNVTTWGTYVGELPLFGPGGVGHASQFDANDTFDHIYWEPGTHGSHKLLSKETVPATRFYYYDVPQDIVDFTARINCTNCVFNVDPLLVSSTDFRPQAGSTLLQHGGSSANCHDQRDSTTACGTPPDIGAYQTITGDPSDQSASAPNITTTTLPGGTVTVAYGQQLGKAGGLAPFVWSKQSGTLPTGLTLDADGLIAGTPTTPGVFTFVPQVTDASARTDTTPPTLSITIVPNPIVITSTVLLSGNVNRAYRQSVTATGGNGSITFAVIAGSLPTGLSMDSAGAITGTPSVVGTSTFTVRATDSVGTTQDQAFSLAILAALVLSTPDPPTCPAWVVSPNVCWYVRPDTDGITDLNYGAEDGTSYATAFDGMASITGMAAGDVVCFPGAGEPFYELFDTTQAGKNVSGTYAKRITYQGCATTKTLWWSAKLFTDDRSYDVAKAVITGITYEWVALGSDVYRKKIDTLPKALWAGEDWIVPKVVYTMTEQQILDQLETGEWGVRDFGDSTFRIYYRAESATQSPAHVVMRIDLLANGPFGHIQHNYLHLKHIEVRGHHATSAARSLQLFNMHHVTLEDMLFYRNQEGYAVTSSVSSSDDILIKNVDVLYNCANGPFLNGGAGGMKNLIIDGGEYSYNGFSGSVRACYLGTGYTTQADGDGIGIGQGGGRVDGVLIKNIKTVGNFNYGVFVGTTAAHLMTNFQLLASTHDGNGRGCFAEGSKADIRDRIIVSGFLCLNTSGEDPLSPAMHISSCGAFACGNAKFSEEEPDTLTGPRTVVIENGVFAGNHNASRMEFEADLNGGWNRYTFRNLVFINNFSDDFGNDHGDFYSLTTNLIGNEKFDHIYLYSKPNTSGEFAELQTTRVTYRYNVGGDLAAFATATGGTNLHINEDPLFLSATDFRTKPTSPLRGAAAISGYCIDVRGRGCSPDHPDIGAYQASGRDQAPTRTVRP